MTEGQASHDPAVMAALRAVGAVIATTFDEDLVVIAVEAARPIHYAQLRAADLAEGQARVAAGDQRMAEYLGGGAADNGEPEDSISRGIADVEAGRIKRLDWITDEGAE